MKIITGSGFIRVSLLTDRKLVNSLPLLACKEGEDLMDKITKHLSKAWQSQVLSINAKTAAKVLVNV